MYSWTVALVIAVAQGAIWKPGVHDTWQWELSSGHIDTSVNAHVFDIDLFDADQSAITKLHSMGRKVICYFSAGSYENWRPDKDDFPSDVLGNNLEHWAGEKWLDIRDDRVKVIMQRRLDRAVSRGCDGVEPDNVDGYSNHNGLGLTAADQLTYNKWLAREAHARSLSVGLKNDVDQIPSLVSYFDWALNEECVQYNECNKYQPFFDAGKAVFHVEYVDNHSQGSHRRSQVCHSSHRPRQLLTLIKDWDLTKWRLTC